MYILQFVIQMPSMNDGKKLQFHYYYDYYMMKRSKKKRKRERNINVEKLLSSFVQWKFLQAQKSAGSLDDSKCLNVIIVSALWHFFARKHWHCGGKKKQGK